MPPSKCCFPPQNFKHLLCLIGLALTLCLHEVPAADSVNFSLPQTVTIGIQESLDPAFFVGTFGPTMAYLRKEFPHLRFQSRFLTLDELEKAIAQKKVQFFMAESGVFAFTQSRWGARDIAVRTTPTSTNPAATVSSTVFVRADSPLHQLEDLEGHSIAAESPNSFGGWTVLQGLVAQHGLSTEHFFSQTLFTHSEFPDVASLVLAGAADAGVLKSCEMERLHREHGLNPAAFRILNPQPQDVLHCAHSGPLYPDIVFASLPTANAQLIGAITVALLSQPPSREGYSWGICPDFSNVDQLFRLLKTGPYRYLREFNWRALWENYWEWVLAVIALGLVTFLHILRTNLLIAKRTAQLRGALQRERNLEQQARESRQRLSQMERVSTISQMSSMLAHEVRQPLYALMNFAGGLRIYVNQHYGKDPAIGQVAQSITEETQRISDIVGRVRSYAQQKELHRETVHAGTVVASALRTFSHSSTSQGTQVHCLPGPELRWQADPLEMELLLVNLMKNGAQAMKNMKESEKILTVSWHQDQDSAVLEVRDRGPEISAQQLKNLSNPAMSTKQEGLGLGLSLCRSIVERLGGHLHFFPTHPGLCAQVVLPLADASEAQS